MSIKNAVNSLMVNGRSASSADAREVYQWIYEREVSARHGHLQGIASAVVGQMNALLERSGHLGFARDERAAFNAWVGLPPVGAKATAASGKLDEALMELGMA
jgi:hypothetical protein